MEIPEHVLWICESWHATIGDAIVLRLLRRWLSTQASVIKIRLIMVLERHGEQRSAIDIIDIHQQSA